MGAHSNVCRGYRVKTGREGGGAIFQLPTQSDQVAEAGRLDRKPKSSLQLHQNQRENKIKKSKLAYWLNYHKAEILQSLPSVQYCQIYIMLDSRCINYMYVLEYLL